MKNIITAIGVIGFFIILLIALFIFEDNLEESAYEIIGKNLPVPKPRIENKNTEKSTQKAEKTKVEKQKTKSTEKIISSAFVFPKKKANYL